MAVFRLELVLAPEHLMRSNAHVIEEAGGLLGFYTLPRLMTGAPNSSTSLWSQRFLGKTLAAPYFARLVRRLQDVARSS